MEGVSLLRHPRSLDLGAAAFLLSAASLSKLEIIVYRYRPDSFLPICISVFFIFHYYMTAFQHPGLGLRTGLQETAAGPGSTVGIETPKTPARRTWKGREKAVW